VSTAGIGVLCQLECEGAFRAEVLRWVPGYTDDPLASAEPVPTALAAAVIPVARKREDPGWPSRIPGPVWVMA
jgi:hypothetical protein